MLANSVIAGTAQLLVTIRFTSISTPRPATEFTCCALVHSTASTAVDGIAHGRRRIAHTKGLTPVPLQCYDKKNVDMYTVSTGVTDLAADVHSEMLTLQTAVPLDQRELRPRQVRNLRLSADGAV
jgi:hypothetical protein